MAREYSDSVEERLVSVVPSPRQLRHQSMEFYGFVHFTVNTFTGREWGDGTESPAVFNPERLDAGQWVQAMKAAGMKALILTCKHHDGFCLWPSRYTEHTVAASPFRGGKGDVVKEVSDACRRYGLAFGVYLSSWDRNNAAYGSGTPYNDYFVNQLEELLTGYGEICSVWFDGACGEGPNGKVQTHDWERYYRTIRELQPGACIHVCGPDVRWCGNEAGYTRKSEWSVVPERTRDTEKIAKKSQKEDSAAFRERKITAGDEDLGSYELVKDEPALVWYPAEVNTSIRPGWFYHREEDGRVKPLSELIGIYEGAVGGNATFLLNVPPSPEGLFAPNDVKRLHEFGEYLKATYGENLADKAKLAADSCEEGHGIEAVRTDDLSSFFKTTDGVRSCRILLTFPEEEEIRRVVLKENIQLSQRIESFRILALRGDEDFSGGENLGGSADLGGDEDLRGCKEKVLYEGTVVGYKKIAVFDPVRTKKLAIDITDARVAPTLSFIGAYGNRY